jgi:hypothetical protein
VLVENLDNAKMAKKNGGRAQDRTGDPCDVNAVLIPLSYAPASNQEWKSFYIGCRPVKATN